ncbi:MAG: NAD(P)-dependent alcohol dehydrogenase [Firmicutes bacterium]|nr:NAD(P)-dependent alcohol dehydrogenase [Bacillota bacterium]
MKAFVMRRIGEVGFMEKEKPKCGPNDAIIRTTRGLVCTSDVHTVAGAIGERTNLTLGHEAVGIVDTVGSEVKLFKPGDRACVGAITPSWGSSAAQRGFPSQSGEALGGWMYSNVKDGSFAEFFHVNEADANMALIPDDISDEAAVYCTDMMSTGFAGSENANIPLGGTVAIFAQGPVGLMSTAAAKMLGAGLIITVETDPKRQELSKLYGADFVVDFAKEDTVKRIMELTDGEGVDSAVEALGFDGTFQQAIRVTKPGGTVSNIGYHGSGEFVHIPREAWGVGMANITIVTDLCPGGRVRMERMLRLLQTKRVDPTHLTSHTFSFDEVDKAYNLMKNKEDNVVKPLIVF